MSCSSVNVEFVTLFLCVLCKRTTNTWFNDKAVTVKPDCNRQFFFQTLPIAM